jgi:hypothetical protein
MLEILSPADEDSFEKGEGVPMKSIEQQINIFQA